MTRRSHLGKRALVTGGAGLIGSHLADLLLDQGWTVRILDNFEPQTHRHGRPAWVPP
jgi:dTDP-L-rhamnose 4-epimerase